MEEQNFERGGAPQLNCQPKKGGFDLNFGRIFLGFFLILTGFLYLAKLSGWREVSFDFWGLWPVILIYWGLARFSAKTRFSVILGGILVIFSLVIIGYFLSENPGPGQPTPAAPYKETILSI